MDNGAEYATLSMFYLLEKLENFQGRSTKGMSVLLLAFMHNYDEKETMLISYSW